VDEQQAVQAVERASLAELGDLDTDAVVYRQVDFLLRELPGPLDLYRRWEQQQWAATELDFGADRAQWSQLHPAIQETLHGTFAAFYIGEQAVTDTLSPLLLGARDEESRLFLATQVVDEARHAYFFARFFQEVLAYTGSLRQIADRASEWVGSPAYRFVFDPGDGELKRTTDAVRLAPQDEAAWVRAITCYHVMVEGLLALTGQRFVLRLLRAVDLLPAFRSGFTAVTRDESRHVSYGIWALRRAVREGHEPAVREETDRCLDACLDIYANPEERLEDPRQLPREAVNDPRDNWRFAVESVTKRLRTAGVAQDYLDDVDRRGWARIRSNVERYEQLHGEHPVRVWERGELTPA
jgi:ribonucleoside-diphosphate reductase beta chain